MMKSSVSQTSPVQQNVIETVPIKIISRKMPRHPDANPLTHKSNMEGLLVDKVTMADLKELWILSPAAFGSDVKPLVLISSLHRQRRMDVLLQMWGKGCRVCKGSGDRDTGCGVVHPNVGCGKYTEKTGSA